MSFVKKYKYWIIGGVALIVIGAVVIAIRRKSLNKLKKSPKSILFVGDSQTTIKNYANNTPIKYTYPNILIEQFAPKGITIDVLAKGGETSSWMLKNLPEKLKEKKFDRIYIQAGGNDAANNVPYEKFKDNIEKMIDLGKKSGAEVVYMVWYDRGKVLDINKLATTIYVPTKEEMYKRYLNYIDWQKKLPNDLKGKADAILPMFEIDKSDLGDAVHPNSKGHKKIAEIISKTI